MWSLSLGSFLEFPLSFPGGSGCACNAGDLGSIPGLERSPAGGHGNLLQHSCLENPHGQRSLTGYSPWVTESRTRLKWRSMHTYTLKVKKWKRRTIQLTRKYGIGIDSSFSFLALCLFQDGSKLFSLPIRVWVFLFNVDVNGSKLACALLMMSRVKGLCAAKGSPSITSLFLLPDKIFFSTKQHLLK